MSKERIARIQISFELLKHLLRLPDDIEISGIKSPHELTLNPQYFEILVTSETKESIPEVDSGETIPIITPTIYHKSVFDRMEI